MPDPLVSAGDAALRSQMGHLPHPDEGRAAAVSSARPCRRGPATQRGPPPGQAPARPAWSIPGPGAGRGRPHPAGDPAASSWPPATSPACSAPRCRSTRAARAGALEAAHPPDVLPGRRGLRRERQSRHVRGADRVGRRVGERHARERHARLHAVAVQRGARQPGHACAVTGVVPCSRRSSTPILGSQRSTSRRARPRRSPFARTSPARRRRRPPPRRPRRRPRPRRRRRRPRRPRRPAPPRPTPTPTPTPDPDADARSALRRRPTSRSTRRAARRRRPTSSSRTCRRRRCRRAR